MNTRLAFIAIALLSLPTLGICAQPTPTSVTTLAPIADAYVQDGKNAAKNFGTDKTLQVETSAKAGNNLDSYLSSI